MNKYFTIVVVLLTLHNCKTPKCNLGHQFPLKFSQAWIADSLCNQHFRLHQRKVFFPERDFEKRIPLEGMTEQCIIKFFGRPNKVIEERDGRGTQRLVYFMSIDAVNKRGEFDQGTMLMVYIRNGVVVKYNIAIT